MPCTSGYMVYDADTAILQDSLHRLHPRSGMGHRHSLPSQINPKIHPLCRLRRPLLRRGLHSRRLRTPRHLQSKLLQRHR